MYSLRVERTAAFRRSRRASRLGSTLALVLGLSLAASVRPPVVRANAGDLDPSFDADGIVTTDICIGICHSDLGRSVVVQPDGRILVAGPSNTGDGGRDFVVVRYLADGNLDPSFDGDGKARLHLAGDDVASDLALQPDGAIVVAGETTAEYRTGPALAVARFLPNGAPDPAFDGDGWVVTPLGAFSYARGVAVGPDGKITVAGTAYAGSHDMAVVRYNVDGSLDSSFDGDGMLLMDIGGTDRANAVALQSDGKIVVVGTRDYHGQAGFTVVRFMPSGAVDGLFIVNFFPYDYAEAMDVALQLDGRIVLAGNISSGAFALVRLRPDGTLDPSLDGDGRVTTGFPGTRAEANAIAVQSDGKLVVAGTNFLPDSSYDWMTRADFALARYQPDGTPDPSFGSGGILTTEVPGDGNYRDNEAHDLALDGAGRIVVVGHSTVMYNPFSGRSPDLAVARYDGGAPPDADGDSVLDASDNCPLVANVDQSDLDLDQVGDACDPDIDGDNAPNGADNCPVLANPDQLDSDLDALGDACDLDDDGDGVADLADNCPLAANAAQSDNDGDGQGDVCDPDDDDDAILDNADNCPSLANADQADLDGDGQGDACDPDDDGDGVVDAADNCPRLENAGQSDVDGDGAGDACDGDDDGDAVLDAPDNCPLVYNPDQADADADGRGDVCDADLDGDGWPNGSDNCPAVANSDQLDTDGDGAGDVCDSDDDADGVADGDDNCPLAANPGQADADHDGIGDACDADVDGDGTANALDNCPLTTNPTQLDTDGDKQGDACDPDDDGDGVADGEDNCPLTANVAQADYDGDGQGDACDPDDDNDNVADVVDAFPRGSLAPTVVVGTCATTVPNHAFPDGSSFNDLIGACAGSPPGHRGQFNQCVAHLTNQWMKDGLLTGVQKGAIMACLN